jgi:hypothetical protein
MSYPPDPSSGRNPGGAHRIPRGHGTGGAPPEPYTQPLPPGPYTGRPSRGYPPPRRDRSRLVFGVLAGVVALLICAGGGFYATYSFTQGAIESDSKGAAIQPTPEPSLPIPSPTVEPTESPSPTPTPSATTPPAVAAPFQDPELRGFAGRVAENGSACRSEAAGGFANVTEAVTCRFDNGFTVRYLKFRNQNARDGYAESVRDGLNGQLDVARDSFWSTRGRRQGVFVAGSENDGSTQYLYWNSLDNAVSGELIVASDDRREAERFWKREL